MIPQTFSGARWVFTIGTIFGGTSSIPFQKWSKALLICQLFFLIFEQHMRLKWFSYSWNRIVYWSNKLWCLISSVEHGRYSQLVIFLGPALFKSPFSISILLFFIRWVFLLRQIWIVKYYIKYSTADCKYLFQGK